jgi:hypothetical protein
MCLLTRWLYISIEEGAKYKRDSTRMHIRVNLHSDETQVTAGSGFSMTAWRVKGGSCWQNSALGKASSGCGATRLV